MTTTLTPIDTRREHQQRVAALLDDLEERRRHLYRLKAGGARYAGIRGLKCEYESARRELLTTVGTLAA